MRTVTRDKELDMVKRGTVLMVDREEDKRQRIVGRGQGTGNRMKEERQRTW